MSSLITTCAIFGTATLATRGKRTVRVRDTSTLFSTWIRGSFHTSNGVVGCTAPAARTTESGPPRRRAVVSRQLGIPTRVVTTATKMATTRSRDRRGELRGWCGATVATAAAAQRALGRCTKCGCANSGPLTQATTAKLRVSKCVGDLFNSLFIYSVGNI
jgi:hypothetical protein